MTESKQTRLPRLLALMIALQAITLAGQWIGGPSLKTAAAQGFDPAARHAEVVDQLKAVNERLDRIATLLESGNLQVKAGKSDEPKTAK